MNIRSQILIHWTEPRLPADLSESIKPTSVGYVDLIRSIYDKGLRFSIPNTGDRLFGSSIHSPKIPQVPMICYTELRLSDVQEHTKRYGKMGIGFDRDWLKRDCGANPVFYVQNTWGSVVTTNLPSIISECQKIENLEAFLSFVKPMSEFFDPDSTNYEEMEWRMISRPAYIAKDNGLIPIDDAERLEKDGYFRFPLDRVLIIVAPDEETQKAILHDPKIQKYFDKHMPMMVTTDSCSQF